jgi:protein gp37
LNKNGGVGISWTDYTWNPVTGCTKISPGCKNCYAASLTKRFEKEWGLFSKITEHKDRLDEPMKHRKPAKIFVCSMSDLFHKDISDSFLDEVFNVMADCKQHIFQILTKRSERMKEYLTGKEILANIWFGVSAENQGRADERIPLLLKVPARVRFISVEPQLQYIDLSRYLNQLDWVIVGGESGRGARGFDLNWARAIKEQCETANVPFFFKQTGGRPNIDTLDGVEYKNFPKEF